MARIEFTRSPIIDREADTVADNVATLGYQSYWQWEAKLLEEEITYFESHLRSLKNTID